MGPGAGVNGGEVVYQGKLEGLKNSQSRNNSKPQAENKQKSKGYQKLFYNKKSK